MKLDFKRVKPLSLSSRVLLDDTSQFGSWQGEAATVGGRQPSVRLGYAGFGPQIKPPILPLLIIIW